MSARRKGVAYCLGVWLAVRLGLLALTLPAVGVLPNAMSIPGRDALGIPGPVSVPGWEARPIAPGVHNLFTAWERFDALWFLRIAEEGYRDDDGSAAFFPLYPVAVKVVSWLFLGNELAAGLLVSNLAFLGALLLLYRLVAAERSDAVARKAVLYLAVFPTAFFFFAPYSESLFLLLAVGSFLAARRDRWGAAAILGALAALTRNVGVLLAPALALEALTQWREDGRKPLPRLAAAAGPALGTSAYLAYWLIRAGDWLAPMRIQSQWQRERMMPWEAVTDATHEAFRWLGTYAGGYHLLDWLLVIPLLAGAAYATARLRPGYWVYAWLGLLIPLSYVYPPRPFMSVPRFALVLFPLFWAIAEAAERGRIPHGVVVGVEAAGLGLLTTLFLNWYYIF